MTAPPSSPRTRRIGIHGARNAGKTCYLGCLYGERVGDRVEVGCADSDTVNALRGLERASGALVEAGCEARGEARRLSEPPLAVGGDGSLAQLRQCGGPVDPRQHQSAPVVP